MGSSKNCGSLSSDTQRTRVSNNKAIRRLQIGKIWAQTAVSPGQVSRRRKTSLCQKINCIRKRPRFGHHFRKEISGFKGQGVVRYNLQGLTCVPSSSLQWINSEILKLKPFSGRYTRKAKQKSAAIVLRFCWAPAWAKCIVGNLTDRSAHLQVTEYAIKALACTHSRKGGVAVITSLKSLKSVPIFVAT